MNDEKKYNALLKELGALLADKNLTIACNDALIEQLERKLAAAEAERDAVRKELLQTEDKLENAKIEIDRMQRARKTPDGAWEVLP